MHQDHSDINTAAENSPQTHENQTGPESEIISHNKLLEAGTYFGHKKDKWNPKMKPYISATKKGMHIIDTKKTKKALEFAYTLIERLTSKGASFIFVGTRKQARETIRNNALRTNSHYVADRWLGGTLTNAKTIFSRVKHMEDLEQKASNDYAGYTKKEGLKYAKELEKLRRNLVGIRRMKSSPNIMIVADPIHDKIAVREARKLGVKVIGIVDTNADPTFVDVAIPANDDSIKSVTLIITILADAIAKAKGGQQLYAYQGDDAVSLPEDRRERLEERQGRGRFGQQRRRSSNLRNNPRPGYSKPKEKTAATPSETTGQTAEPKTEKESDQDGTNREN